MTFETRKQIIAQIENKRQSRVITLVTGDRPNVSASLAPDVIPIMYENIRNFRKVERKNIDLFIYSRGGDSNVPWTIVSMIREVIKDGVFAVLIPYKAHSAATVIAIGADEIIMGEKGELGPIDATIEHGPYNPMDEKSPEKRPVSVEDVTGYFELLYEKCGPPTPDISLRGYSILADKVHPLALGQVKRLLQHTKHVAEKLLNARKTKLPDKMKEKILKSLASGISSHSHAISRSEARNDVGLDYVKDAESYDIHEQIWNLYLDYADELDIAEPFLPSDYFDLNPGQLENTWQNLRIAFCETANQSYYFGLHKKIKRIKEFPPSLQVSVGSIGLPPLPPLPQGLNANQVMQAIQNYLAQIVPQAVNNVVDNTIKSLVSQLPDIGFQATDLSPGWRKQ
jgi:hypothetical protein